MTVRPQGIPASPRDLARALRNRTIGIIGAGNMGQALIRGLVGWAKIPPQRIVVREVNRHTIARVRRQYRVQAISLDDLAVTSDVIILAVKPQDLNPVLQALRPLLVRRTACPLVISIAAGVQLRAIERHLGRCPVVRVMPNLAATVGSAISAMAAGRFARPSHRALARAIFCCVGRVVEVPERLFDAVTAVSGSGPAYFFLIFQALRDAGVRAGLAPSVAHLLVVETAFGSADLVSDKPEDFEALIRRVASKGGTTEAALKLFQRRHLAEVLQAGVLAATKRSKELTRLLQ